jgi:trigger factor
LKIEKNIRDDHQAELAVEIDPERMEAAKRRAARKLAERGKIPGFRPGKAPYEAVDLLVDDIYPEVLKRAEIEPAAAGALEKIESVDPPKFIFRVPLMPTVDLGDYLSIRLPYEWTAPGQEKLDEALEELRQMYASTETVERGIEVGDYVLLDVKGEKKDAKEEEDLSDLSRTGVAVMVRKEDRDDEWPFTGFAKELAGLKPGESKTIKHKFPKDHEDDRLKAATVNYEATVKTVRSVILPELNNEFAKMVGEKYESLDQLKEVLAKDLESRLRAEYDDEYFAKLIDKVKEGAAIKYPPQVAEHECEHVLEDLTQRLTSQNMDMETYFKLRQTTQEKFMEEEVRPVAAKRLERGLILEEIARRHKIELDKQSLADEFSVTLNRLASQGAVDFAKLNKSAKETQARFSTAIASESANRLITRRSLEKLKSIAVGEYKPEDDAPKQPEAESKAEETAASPEAGAEPG